MSFQPRTDEVAFPKAFDCHRGTIIAFRFVELSQIERKHTDERQP